MSHPAILPIRRLLDAAHDSAKRGDVSFDLEITGEILYDQDGRWGVRATAEAPIPTGGFLVDADAGTGAEREKALTGSSKFRLVYRCHREELG